MKSSEVRKQCLGCGVDFVSQKYRNRKFHNQECYWKNQPIWNRGKVFKEIPKETLYQKYIIERKNMNQIAKEVDCCDKILRKRFHEYNIKVRRGSWNKGIPHTEESKRKMSEKAILRIEEKNPFYGKHHTEQTKHKIGEANKGRHHSEESKKRMSIMRKGKPHSEEHKRKMVMLWKKPEYKERCLKAIIKGMFKRPTSLENQFMEFIQKHNLPYKYVGNGEFLIGFKNPDFVNVNGEKICIDVRSKEVCKYFSHQTPMEYEKQRIEHFAKYGWKCVVILAERNNKRNWKFYKSNKEILHFLEPIDGIKTNGGIL